MSWWAPKVGWCARIVRRRSRRSQEFHNQNKRLPFGRWNMNRQLAVILCFAVLGFFSLPSQSWAQAKTAKACTEEWRADKAGFQAKGITEKAYVAECRSGTVATPATAPAPAPTTAAPAPAPAPTTAAPAPAPRPSAQP